MKSATTSDRLKQIMELRGLKQADIIALVEPFCKEWGVRLGKNDLSQYVSGKVTPKQDKLAILGMALGVSEPWLMGFDVSMERTVQPTDDTTDGLAAEAFELINLLPKDKLPVVINVIKGLLKDE